MAMLDDVQEVDLNDSLRAAVRGALDDFSRRVRQAHSFDEVEAHRDELAELIVGIVSSSAQERSYT
jgi:hypothetical protein